MSSELLAPAGNIEALDAAIGEGADAVYLACDKFGMRARATNFALEEMPEVVAYAHGRGVAVNQETGERVYLHMDEISAGIGLGATEYDLVFVIANEDAWNAFIAGKTRFGMSASASATDGVAGGAVEGANVVANGIWLYQMTKKGVSLEATISGMKIYADKNLN